MMKQGIEELENEKTEAIKQAIERQKKEKIERIDIQTSIKGSNYVINTNAVNNLGAEPARAPMLFETSQLAYKHPISQEFGYIFEDIGRNTQAGKTYELEDIIVVRRHPETHHTAA